ncbi:hypothetical protein ONZ45_g17694 [Pleurotus djamor]|nr:hypothetical protein ONZ45_g17694 [Pleurotus djamor]
MAEMITSNLSLEVLLGSLQNTPELEALRVREVITSNDEAAMDQILPVASLPHLSHLDISGLTISSSKLFQCINYPKTTSVSFDCQTFTTGSDLSHLLNALNHFTSDPDQIIQEVTITTLNNFEMLLESLDISQFFNLTLKGAAFNSPTAAIAILAAVPFSQTTFLHLDCISQGTIQPSLFAKCGEVHDLTLTACPVEVFRGLSELKGSQLPFPNLRNLYVNQCIFNYSSVERDSAMCKAMMAFLKQRKRMKARIQQLTICRCDISGSVVEEFEKFVSVEWDNYEVQDDEQQEEDYDESEEDWSEGEGLDEW